MILSQQWQTMTIFFDDFISTLWLYRRVQLLWIYCLHWYIFITTMTYKLWFHHNNDKQWPLVIYCWMLSWHIFFISYASLMLICISCVSFYADWLNGLAYWFFPNRLDFIMILLSIYDYLICTRFSDLIEVY